MATITDAQGNRYTGSSKDKYNVKDGGTYFRNGVAHIQSGRYPGLGDQKIGDEPKKTGRATVTFRDRPELDVVGTQEKEDIARQEAANLAQVAKNKAAADAKAAETARIQEAIKNLPEGASVTEIEGIVDKRTQTLAPIDLTTQPTGLAALVQEDSIAGTIARVITSPKTTVALVATLLTMGAGVAIGGAAAATTARTGVARVIAGSVGKPGVKAVITRTATVIKGTRGVRAGTSITTQAAKAGGAATTRTAAVQKLFTAARVTRVAVNPKTVIQSTKALGGVFSAKTLGIVAGWGTLVFMGRWAQAEGPEGLTFPLNKLVDNAETPEDWAFYNEYRAAAEEISDLEAWEEIMLWTPAGPIIGISNKMKGVKEGIKVIDKRAEIKQREQQRIAEQGESDFARERRESDEAAFERKREFAEEEGKRFEDIQEENLKREEEASEKRTKEREEETARFDKIRKESDLRRDTEIKEDTARFADIRKETDLRRTKEIEEDTARFAGIRKEADETRRKQIEEDEKRFADIAAANKQRDIDELNFKEEYFKLLREGKYEEAAALLDAWERG